LAQHHLDAVVIGAVALAAHHYVRQTDDLDLGVNADLPTLPQSGEREVVRFWRLGMGVFFGGSSSPEKAKSTSSVSGFSSF
jgi:hypothetical protein